MLLQDGDNDSSKLKLVGATIDQLSTLLATGRLTSIELVAAYLNRIAAYDRRGPKLNSTPVLNPKCFQEAAQADLLLLSCRRAAAAAITTTKDDASKGLSHVLTGIPFTVKDSFKVKDLPVAAGSPAFASLQAQNDAFVVQALRASGAIVLGKTNMPPMAIGGCQRGVYGRAESPYNADFLPAAWHSGSSSGSGSAVAASLCAFGLGEETVSSGRSPASNCGLVAYTPSRGLVSVRGNWPLFALRDVVVPHARCMRDLLCVLDVLVTEDPDPRGDLWKTQRFVSLPPVTSVRPRTFVELAATKTGALKGLRLGVPRMYTGEDSGSVDPIHVRPSILRLFADVRQALSQLGATCVDVDLPVVSHYEQDRPGTTGLVERGILPRGWNDEEINDLVSASWDEFLRHNGDENHLSLASIKPEVIHADPPDAVDTRRSTLAHPGQDQIRYDYIVELSRKAENDTATSGKQRPPLEYPRLAEVCVGLERARKELFEDWLLAEGLDGIFFPANADIAPADADINELSSKTAWQNGTVFSNMNHVMRHLGIPSVSVTMGIMTDTNMPVNVTFAGKAYSDTTLLRWACEYEDLSRKRAEPAIVPDLELPTLNIPTIDRQIFEAGKPSAMPSLTVLLSGNGKIDVSGAVRLEIKATVLLRLAGDQEQQEEGKGMVDTNVPVPIGLNIVTDGIHHFQVNSLLIKGSQVFDTTMYIPAAERRGARLQSSLVVATAVLICNDSNGASRVAGGQYIEITYCYP